MKQKTAVLIRVLATGGTIDDRDITHKRPNDPITYLPDILAQSRITLDVNVETLMQKDSREIAAADRKTILDACRKTGDRIIITHGTFTMPETARYLGERIKNKVIVLTGSNAPFIDEKSDALFNFGCAFTAVQTLPNGVYLVMNGKVFSWDNVRKNLKTETFEKINEFRA